MNPDGRLLVRYHGADDELEIPCNVGQADAARMAWKQGTPLGNGAWVHTVIDGDHDSVTFSLDNLMYLNFRRDEAQS